MTRVSRTPLGLAVFLCISLGAATACAHDVTITPVVGVIKADGTYLIDMRVNVDALALGVRSSIHSDVTAPILRDLSEEELARALDYARHTIERRIRIRFDGKKVVPFVTFSDYDHPLGEPSADSPVFGTTVRLVGRYPKEATEFTFGASRAFNTVHLTILDEANAGGVTHVLTAGEDSPPYRLHEPMVNDHGFVFARYLVLGFQHILPKGVDHILFVLGLYLLSTRLRPLLLQITAFTVAHSVTLALSMAGVASLPARVVEPLIAASITYVAIENVLVHELKPWRPAVVFMFGLLHGMGFAGVLRELGMPEGRFVPALVGFNVGVEFGQLAVVTMAFLVLGWFRNKPWYHKAIMCPLSIGIALIGSYWAIQRVGLLP
ncbi:MAG: HupE/UreJ family protein [Phycisphaerae bacterium]|jgi:hypothetical protein